MNKRRILFVDDDLFVIRGLKRAAEDYSDDWETYFVTSGQEALTVLQNYPMDIIISDMRMPSMDGAQLLEITRQRFPGVVRFILSGNTENAKLLQASRLAHQFIPKPCNMSQLKEIVDQACALRDTLANPLLIQTITRINTLPSLPKLYVRLMEALQAEEPAPKLVGDIISQDVAMTAKILQLVNSAFFSLPGKVNSPQKAVTILGINTIKALVLSIQVFSEYQGRSVEHFSMDELWRHSLTVGNLSQLIAQNIGLNKQGQADAQVSGVLHDIGKLIELEIPAYTKLLRFNTSISLEMEIQQIGTSHAELGAYLLSIWGLPQDIIEAVAYHHHPQVRRPDAVSTTAAVYIANAVYHMETALEKKPIGDYLDIKYLNKIGLKDHIEGWPGIYKKLVQSPRSDKTN